MNKPTAFQKKIAKALGVSLLRADTFEAASRISAHIAPALFPEDDPKPPTAKQIKFARDLGVYDDGDTFRLLAAKIQAELTRRNEAALRRLRLKPGDVVDYTRRSSLVDNGGSVTSRHVVSSVGRDLRVYFKNPVSESGGWPSQLTVVKRAT